MEQKKEMAETVKKKLWMFGYSVKDFSEVNHVAFDLLVEGKFRVVVGDSIPKTIPEDCDVYAVVRKDIVTFVGATLEQSASPYSVFGKI